MLLFPVTASGSSSDPSSNVKNNLKVCRCVTSYLTDVLSSIKFSYFLDDKSIDAMLFVDTDSWISSKYNVSSGKYWEPSSPDNVSISCNKMMRWQQQSWFNLNIICLSITEVVHPAVKLCCLPPGLADLHWLRHDHWHYRGVHGDWYVWNNTL